MAFVPLGPVDDMTIAGLPFPTAQALLHGAPITSLTRQVDCEWHGAGPDGDPDRGCYALVREGSDLEDLIGERIRVTYQGSSVRAYVKAAADLDDDLSLTRTLMIRIAPLAQTTVTVLLEVLR